MQNNFFLFQSGQEAINTLDESVTEETPLSPRQSLDNAFTIKDLSSLLKNLEAEIALNEQHLNDENDKRYMFKVSKILPNKEENRSKESNKFLNNALLLSG